jgi:nitroreductase
MSDFLLKEIQKRRTVRSFSEEKVVLEKDLELMILAAGRAPSSFNAQPWRFMYAHKSSALGKELFALLLPTNAAWADRAQWLVLVGAHEAIDYKNNIIFNEMAVFDTGAAAQNFSLQAVHAGFATAVIGGFDHARAKVLAADYMRPLCMIVVGCADGSSGAVSLRKNIEEIAIKG